MMNFDVSRKEQKKTVEQTYDKLLKKLDDPNYAGYNQYVDTHCNLSGTAYKSIYNVCNTNLYNDAFFHNTINWDYCELEETEIQRKKLKAFDEDRQRSNFSVLF